MTPSDLSNRYQTLRTRVSVHCPDGCAEISLRLPSDFGGELAFYRLVIWGYVLVNEAARVPLAFLAGLPPLKANRSFRDEMRRLRTYLTHNLGLSKARDQRTRAFVHRWFREACGHGSPEGAAHYAACCDRLAGRLRELLDGAIAACDLLDGPEDGPRLVADLRGRLEVDWEASRFDPLVEKCAARLGDPGIDLMDFRSRQLDKWREALSQADENERERVLEQRIEADLLAAIGDALPRIVREKLQQVAASAEATVAALLLLRETRRLGAMSLPQIIEFVSSQATGLDGSEA